MKINVVIGAGQLGSRHLQGLLRLTIKQKIFIHRQFIKNKVPLIKEITKEKL